MVNSIILSAQDFESGWKDALLDTLKDSAISLAVIFLVYFILSFVEGWLSEKMEKTKKISPLLGALFGLIPQCGSTIVAADLFLKEKISMGTLVAVFIACSDEALPIILSSPSKAFMSLPLIGVKLVVGALVGFTVDLIYKPKLSEEEIKEKIHIGCCGHEIENEEENPWHAHLVHPLIHSLKIFAYIFVVSLVFSFVVLYVGEDSLKSFLEANKYLAPLYSALVGLIPNCASSVVISELYIRNGLSFGAALSGLVINAGLGMTVLLKDRKAWKKTLAVFLITFLTALVCGYVACLILGF
jgi:hypothetical protein